MTNKMINLTPDISTIISTVAQPKALVVFAHGAGADKSHEFMEQVSLALNQKNINVLRFNFSYMDVRLAQGNRRPPDRMPKLLECFSTVIDGLESDLPLFIAGKSMGGRVAATLAGDKTAKFLGVMCLGYPFHPQKKPEK
ncbi:MAG: putative alpha/beta-hydrolase family hydrolase, partial [Colwellia sp.]